MSGRGDYRIQNNALFGVATQVPRFGASKNGRRTVVRHREYISDIISSAGAGMFRRDTYALNPGNILLFPWLATMAEQFEEYRIKGLLFEFRSMSGDAITGSNTALGTVAMCTQYNVLQPIFNTKQQMENYEFGMSARPSESMIHPIECKKSETPTNILDTRTVAAYQTYDQSNGVTAGTLSGGIPANADLRLYDWGNFTIATQGMQGVSVNLGELWCTYDIEFLKPKVSVGIDVADHYQLSITTINTAGTTAPFGQSCQPFISGGGVIAFGDSNEYSPGGVLTFKPTSSSDMGTYISYNSAGTGSNTITWPASYVGAVQVCFVIGYLAVPLQPPRIPECVYTLSGNVTGLKLLNNNGAAHVFCPTDSIYSVAHSNNGIIVFFLSINGGGSFNMKLLTPLSDDSIEAVASDLFIFSLPALFS